MRLVDIAQRTVSVELDPEDCVLLAEACRYGYLHDGDKLGGPAPVFAALAFAFDAAAMAAQAANALADYRDQPVSLMGRGERCLAVRMGSSVSWWP